MKKQNSPNREEAFLLPTRRQRLSQGLVRCDQLIRLAVRIMACVSSRLSTHLSESESDASSAEMNKPKLRYRSSSIYSRSYAEDVTSVTSGASQGPHSFNLVFVCLCVCVTPGAIPYLSRTVPYHQTQLATYSWPQYSNRAFKRKIIT